MLVAFAITLSTASFANPVKGNEATREPVSTEIQKMLSDSNLIVEEEFVVTVIFKVTEDRKIDVQTVRSENEEVNEFLKKRLQNQKLHGNKWFSEKIYELPVKVQAMK
ncbi:MAG: hypothetical protein WBL27_01620 [Salinimicrobium sp.]